MGYIGRQNINGRFQKLSDISGGFNGSATAFTLQSAGVNVVPNSEQNVLIAAHGNSLRAICKYLFNISDEMIVKLEIPTGNPIEINLDNKLKVIDYSYMDVTRAKEIYFNK